MDLTVHLPYMPNYIHAHSSSHAIKALIVSLLITFLSAVFPFLHSLTCPYLLSLSSQERGLQAPQTKGAEEEEERGRSSNNGGMRRENGEEMESKAARLIGDDTHTHTQYARTQGLLFRGFAAEAL